MSRNVQAKSQSAFQSLQFALPTTKFLITGLQYNNTWFFNQTTKVGRDAITIICMNTIMILQKQAQDTKCRYFF